MTATRSLRTFLVALVLVLSAVASLSFASAAGAATKCGERVLADWYDNGRIDKLYPLNCYEEAIDAIPDDIGPYVDAEDVITRALQGALRNELDPGGCDPTADGSADDCKNQGGTARAGTARTGTNRTTATTAQIARARCFQRSTRPGRRPSRSHCSCSAGSRSHSLPQVASDTSRDAVRLRTPTTSVATTRSSEASADRRRQGATG